MNVYTTMPKQLQPFYQAELQKYAKEFVAGDLAAAWNHLERAHIIGQKYPFAHTLVHWKMLRFGFKVKSLKEIFGQIPRLLFGGIKSFIGEIPEGNPGGANVPPLKSFPIEKDLEDIFMKAGMR
jgi:hypothetical protein